MGYVFLKFSGIYSDFEKQFLFENPDSDELSYEELNSRYIRSRYGYSDYFTKYMKKLGNEAHDFVATFKILQKSWARDYEKKYHESNWLKEIILHQINYIQPDVIFVIDINLFDTLFRNKIRKICKKDVKIVAFHTNDIFDFKKFNDIDLFCTGIQSYVEQFQRYGFNSLLFSHAFEHTLLNEINAGQKRDYDFTFTGSLGNGIDAFSIRYQAINELLLYTPLQVWGRIDKRNYSLSSLKRMKIICKINRLLNNIGIKNDFLASIPVLRRTAYTKIDPTSPQLNEVYKERLHEPVFGLEYYSLLAKSKIVFNIHGEYRLGKEAVNMRLYEATGMGACLITDWKENIAQVFEPDVEIITYKNIDDCVNKVLHLLENESEREAIARAGQKRTLKEHTWENRIRLLDAKLCEMLVHTL